jgi:hypothetical protein
MKGLITTFSALFLIGCISQDFDENRYITLKIEEAITVENNVNYAVGDTLFFEVNFSRYLEEEGYNNLLDIYQSSGSSAFRYFYQVSKFSDLSNDFQGIDVSPDFILVEKGTSNDSGAAFADLNNEKTQYESRIGVILAEAGTFELNFDRSTFYSYSFLSDKVEIDIINTFSNGIDKFEFTVNE